MKYTILVLAAALGCVAASHASAQDGANAWIEAAARAAQHSQLTLPGSTPFHLSVEVTEGGEPNSDYRAKIEEDWVAPDKWRRRIESPDFSQTLVVNGENTLEKDEGDYFPWWLNHIVTALFDPVPGLVMPSVIRTDPFKKFGPGVSSVCPGVDTQTDRWHFCFEPRRELLTFVFNMTTGYAAEFKEFKEFAKKQVPRELVFDPESGTKIQAKIIELSELQAPDERMFTIGVPTSPADRIKTVHINEATLRKLSLTSTEIHWPVVGGGLAKGGCAVYVSADRAGRIREVWPGGCDNTGLEDPLRQTVRKWQLRPATSNGVRVQVEARLTFAFEAKVIPNPLPELSDVEVRKLATKIVEPRFPQGSGAPGTKVAVSISVDESGKLTGCGNPQNLETPVFGAIYQVLDQWRFRPYIKDGKPQYFHATLEFEIH